VADLEFTLALDESQLRAALQRIDDRARQTSSGMSNAFTSASASFAFASQNAQTLVGVLQGMGRAIGEAERHATAVRNLGEAYSLVSAATRGAVSAEEAYRAQQGFVQAGIRITDEQLAAITRRAREYAIATGTDTTQALQQLTDALRQGEAGGLRRFGVSLREGENRTTAFRLATEQFAQAQRNAQPPTNTASESIDGLGRALREVGHDLINGAMAAGRFVVSLATIPTATIAQQEAAERVAGRDRIAATLRRHGLTEAQIGRMDNAARVVAAFNLNRGASLVNVLSATPDLVRQGNEALARARAERTETAAQEAALDAAFTPGAQDRLAAARPAGRGGGGGVSRERVAPEQIAEQRRIAAEWVYNQFTGRREGEERAQAEENAAADERQEQMKRDQRRRDDETIAARNQRRSEELARKAEDDETERRDNEQRMNAGVQFQTSFSDIMRGTGTTAQLAARTVRGAFDTMTNSFKSHLSALITGRETVGEALRGIAHETLLNLATESAVRSLFEFASAIAATATLRFPQAAQHAAAGAMFAGIAVAAGVGAAVTAPPAAASAAPSGAAERGPASPGTIGAGGGQAGPTIINLNVNSALATREDVQDTVRRATDFAAARGSVPISMREIENSLAA